MKIVKKKLLIIIAILAVVLVSTGVAFGLNGFFGGGSKIPEDTMTNGLVGYWGFEEGKGTVAHDSSNYANTGTIKYMSTNTDAWAKGKVGSALSFDGSDDYVDAGNSSVFDSDTFSLEAWFKTNTIAPTFQSILTKSGSGADFDLQLEGSTLKFYIYQSGGTVLTYSTAIAANTWYHVVITDAGAGADNLKMYINGVQVTSTSPAGARVTNSNNFYIGASSNWPGRNFNGLIDEARVYSRALTAAEVKYHFNRGGPVGEWKMDEGEGRTVYDSTDNNNDGTLVLAGSATSSAWVSGKYGSALSFDGVDDVVNVSDSANLDITSDITVEAWVKLSVTQTATDIVQKGTGSGCNGYTLYIRGAAANGVFAITKQCDGSSIASSITVPLANTWYHVVGIKSGSTGRIYVNGVLEGTDSSFADFENIDALSIGKGGDGYFNGLIDDLRIYNYARTPDEIRLDYNAGFAAKFGYTNAGCAKDPASCMTQGLVGYWGFEEGKGTVAHDSSDYANTGTFNDSPSWDKGKVGGAVSFDGGATADKVTIPASASLAPTEFTIMFWLKTTNVSKSIFSGYNEAAFGLVINLDGTGLVQVAIPNVAIMITGATSVSTGNWTHIITTKDASGNYNLFINGVLDGTGSTPTAPLWANWAFGKSDAAYLGGSMDEVRAYNRVLSAEEIRYHYNKGGPVAQWKMDEGEGRTVYDSTDNNNDGTLVLAGSATSSAWVSGKYGSALSFDGVDDRVSVSDTTGSVLDITTAITIGAWVNLKDVSDNRQVVAKESTGSGNNDPYHLSINTSGKAVGRFGNTSTNQSITGTTNVADGNWHYVIFTYDSNYLYIYVDGKSDATPVAKTITPTTNDTALMIGSWNNIWNKFLGLIDDVRIYNYARTQDQIRLDYNEGLAAKFGKDTSSCDQDPNSCITKGLVGYWGFEEGKGLTAHDASDYANTGALTSGPSWTTGKKGGALNFDGTDDHVNAGNAVSLQMSTQLTAEAWIKLTRTANYEYIIAKGVAWSDGWWIQKDINSMNVNFDYVGAGGGRTTASMTLTQNEWAHVLYIFDAGTVRGYLNGQQKTTDTFVDTSIVNANTLNFRVGIAGDGSSYPTQGNIDEVRVYNRVLSVEEVRYHYNKGGPVGQWKMDEGEGRTVYDSTDNNNDGTLYLLGSATSSAWVQGNYGGALKLDGVDDYARVTGNTGLNPNTQFTISSWVKPSALSASTELLYRGNLWQDLYIHANGRLDWGTYISSVYYSGYQTPVNTVAIGKWTHVVLTYSNADGNKYRWYANGVKVAEGVTAGQPDAGSGDLFIGSYGGTCCWFNGNIDDLKIYNYARTQEQVRQDYNNGLGAHLK